MANTGKDNPGNFANDREKAKRAGRKGGSVSPNPKVNLVHAGPHQEEIHQKFGVRV